MQGSLFADEAPAADESGFASTTVDRIRPPVKAHGSKYYLARRIVPILLSVREKITEYLGHCAFGASVFLAMARFEREILGDVNPEVAALWTVLSRESLAGALADRVNRPTRTFRLGTPRPCPTRQHGLDSRGGELRLAAACFGEAGQNL